MDIGVLMWWWSSTDIQTKDPVLVTDFAYPLFVYSWHVLDVPLASAKNWAMWSTPPQRPRLEIWLWVFQVNTILSNNLGNAAVLDLGGERHPQFCLEDCPGGNLIIVQYCLRSLMLLNVSLLWVLFSFQPSLYVFIKGGRGRLRSISVA